MNEPERTEVIGDASVDRGPGRAEALRERIEGLAARRLTGWRSGPRAVRLLAAGLVAAVGVALVLGGVLVAQFVRSAPQRAAVDAATAWARAVDTHDLAAMQAGTVPFARALVVGRTGAASSDRPFRDRLFVDDGQLTFAEGLQLRLVGEPVPVGDLQVAMTTELTCPDGDQTRHLTVVTLRPVGDGLKVASVVMTPQEGSPALTR